MHNKRIVRACFTEGEEGVRNWHYHILVQDPNYQIEMHDSAQASEQPKSLGERILKDWAEFDEAGKYSIAKPIHDHDVNGWLRYIVKEVNNSGCGLCTITSHLPV